MAVIERVAVLVLVTVRVVVFDLVTVDVVLAERDGDGDVDEVVTGDEPGDGVGLTDAMTTSEAARLGASTPMHTLISAAASEKALGGAPARRLATAA